MLDKQLEQYKDQINDFVIDEIISNDKMVLVEGHISYRMWFAFYEHFIVCSGDYGEWVFDCTWETVVNGMPNYSNDLYYLLRKLSKDNKKYSFCPDQKDNDIDEWFENWKEENSYWDILDEEKQKETIELVEDLKYFIEDEYRRTTFVDDFMKDFKDITDYEIDYNDYYLYECGNIYTPQLVVNLGCLKKINEYLDIMGLRKDREKEAFEKYKKEK